MVSIKYFLSSALLSTVYSSCHASTTGTSTVDAVETRALDSEPVLSVTASPSEAPKNNNPVISPDKVELISMTFIGLNPLSPEDLQWFVLRTQDYITDYYNNKSLGSFCGGVCLQEDIDVTDVVIEVTEQNPPFGKRMRNLRSLRNSYYISDTDFDVEISTGSTSTRSPLNGERRNGGRFLQSNNKITITYSQKMSYQKVNGDVGDINPEDIIREPFNNISKRGKYRESFIKAPEGDVPVAFETLSTVGAPDIKEPSSSFFSIGVIAAIAAGGLVILVLIVFLVCRCRGGKETDSKYPNFDEPHPKSTRSGRSNEYQNGQLPSQVQLPELKDEVSTLVDPSPQYGVFNTGGKSLQGYNNTPSVATMDPDYVGIYSGGAEDPSVVSSSGGTFGSNTHKSKFTMESTLTPGMNAGGQSIYTEDEQAFEDHLRNRKKAKQREDYFDIYAPGGKLGVVIDTPNSGAPVVHNIKETCPIADQLRVGDKLIAVDDEDVRSMTAVKVSKLISQKSNNPTRKFTICRAIEELEES